MGICFRYMDGMVTRSCLVLTLRKMRFGLRRPWDGTGLSLCTSESGRLGLKHLWR